MPPSKVARFDLQQASARHKIDTILKNMHARLLEVEAENIALKLKLEANRKVLEMMVPKPEVK